MDTYLPTLYTHEQSGLNRVLNGLTVGDILRRYRPY